MTRALIVAAFTAVTGVSAALNATCTTTIVPAAACCPPIAGQTSTAYVDCRGCSPTYVEGPSCRKLCGTPSLDPFYTATVTACSPCAESTTTMLTSYVAPMEPSSSPCSTIVEPSSSPCSTTIEPSSGPSSPTVQPSSIPSSTSGQPSSTPCSTTIEPSTTPCSTTVEPSSTPCSTTTSPCTTTVTTTADFPCGDCGVKAESTVTIERDCKGCALATTTLAGPAEVGICVCPTAIPVTTIEVCSMSY